MEEWIGHPVTVALVKQLEARTAWLQANRENLLVPYEPQRTQEGLVELTARLAEIGELQEAVTSKDTFEYVRENDGSSTNMADGLPGTGEARPY